MGAAAAAVEHRAPRPGVPQQRRGGRIVNSTRSATLSDAACTRSWGVHDRGRRRRCAVGDRPWGTGHGGQAMGIQNPAPPTAPLGSLPAVLAAGCERGRPSQRVWRAHAAGRDGCGQRGWPAAGSMVLSRNPHGLLRRPPSKPAATGAGSQTQDPPHQIAARVSRAEPVSTGFAFDLHQGSFWNRVNAPGLQYSTTRGARSHTLISLTLSDFTAEVEI
jgi:hypothetical protein